MTHRFGRGTFALLLLGALSGTACSNGNDGDGGGAGTQPLYGIESLTFGAEGSFSYIILRPNLDTQPTIPLASGREFAAYSPADPLGGDVIVGSGESPTFTGYSVDDAGTWTEKGKVSFSYYSSMPLDASVYASATKAFVPYNSTDHVVWNPSSYTIGAVVGAPAEIPLTRGDQSQLKVWRGYAAMVRGTSLFTPYYWADESYHQYSQESQLSVIDTETEKVKAVLDVPCPHLHIASEDEAGNLYYSNGQGSISAAVLDPSKQLRNCFVRVPAGQDAVDASSVTYFKDLAGGREGSNLFIIGNGLALFNVYHAERDSFGDAPTFDQVDYSSSYHLWTYDLNTKEAKPLEGIDYAGGQFVAYKIDGRTFVTVPAADYSTTAVYEVLSTGVAEKRFDVEGWAFKMFRIR